MCGINGIISFSEVFNFSDLEEKVRTMNDIIKHRGPDSEGFFSKKNIVLGFQRLSIIDLSSEANQPMISDDESIVIVFNGEIYNYIEIHKELVSLGHRFNTKSDTEVLINAYKQWGTDCVNKFNGMWSFVLFDFNKNLFFASRDRLGVKPLYYYYTENYLIFSSETKSICSVEDLRIANRSKVFEYLAYGYNKTNDGETFIYKLLELLPGHNLIIENSKSVKIKKYWELKANQVSFKNTNEMHSQFETLFNDSLKIRFRSDVPIGLLLSGGLDSSIIAKKADMLIDSNLIEQTSIFAYTASFPGFDKDEYKLAEDFIKTTSHITLKKITTDISSIIPNLDNIIYGLDQPVQSFTSIVHYKIMQEINKDGIKVAFNGQGADEAFYGYDRYIIGFFLIDCLLKKKGNFLKQYKAIKEKLKFSNTFIFNQIFKALISKKKASYIRSKYIEGTMNCLNQEFISENVNNFKNNYKFNLKGNNLRNYSIEHIKSTGLNTILHYEDISSMLNSVEMRSPFLDYRLIEFAFSLPDNEKFDMGVTKKCIRSVFDKLIPKSILNNNNKIGFNTPFNSFMKEDLFKQYIEELLNSKAFNNREIWNSDQIKMYFNNSDQHPNFPFWRFINLEIWAKTNKIINL